MQRVVNLESSSETLPGSVFLAHAVPYEDGDLTNIVHFEREGRKMPCFLTFSCEGQHATLRRP